MSTVKSCGNSDGQRRRVRLSKRLASALLFLGSCALLLPFLLVELGIVKEPIFVKIGRAIQTTAGMLTTSSSSPSEATSSFDGNFEDIFGAFAEMTDTSARSLPHNNAEARFRAYKSSVRVMVTLIVEDPEGPATWDAREAIAAHFEPHIAALGDFFDFNNVTARVAYYGSIASKAPKRMRDEYYYYSPSDVKNMLEANDWVDGPLFLESFELRLNFWVFSPRCDVRPLVLRDPETGSTSSSFLVTDWGGVHILRDECSSERPADYVSTDALAPAFRAFGGHLRELLGISGDPASDVTKAAFLRSSLQHTAHMALSMQSLVADMPSMSALERALAHMRTSFALFNASRATCCYAAATTCSDCAQALKWARESLKFVVTAYFDHDLLPQLFFPDQHLLAVHLPLLAPLSLPLFVGLFKELQRHFRKARERRDEKKKQE